MSRSLNILRQLGMRVERFEGRHVASEPPSSVAFSAYPKFAIQILEHLTPKLDDRIAGDIGAELYLNDRYDVKVADFLQKFPELRFSNPHPVPSETPLGSDINDVEDC